MKFGFCVVGCGNFAKHFAESIQPLLCDTDLYFASRNIEKAKTYTNLFNGKAAFGSYEEAATARDVTAMYICTPHHLHLEHANLAATNGKHILIEKPLGRTSTEANKIISIAEKYDVKLMIAENYRFIPTVRLSKKLLDEESIGKIRIIQIQQETNYIPNDWRRNRDLNGGGVFIDAGIHKVHFLRYLMGEPTSIYSAIPGITSLSNQQAEDSLILVAQWANGAVGLINHSWVPSNHHTHHWISLSGTTGQIFFAIDDGKLILNQGDLSKTIEVDKPYDGILPMAREFINSILENRQPEVDGEEGIKDIRLVEIAYNSAYQNKSIAVNSNSNTENIHLPLSMTQ